MARAIRAGGAMDEDTAYVEAVGSSRAMASLQYLGLPLPQDPLGGTLRYQTDHDEVGRATSCGPRTSRLMVKVLADEAIRLGIPFYNHTTAVKILTEGEGQARRVCGVLTVRPKQASRTTPSASCSSSARSSSSRPADPASSIATASIPTAASARSAWRSMPGSSSST